MYKKNNAEIITKVNSNSFQIKNDGSIMAVVDSGTMITFSSTCLMNIFKDFIVHNKIRLIVSSDVSDESVWKPISNKRFALNAARIKHLFNKKIVQVVNSNDEIRNLEFKIMDLANNSFKTTIKYLISTNILEIN